QGKLEYIYSLGYYINYSEKRLNRIAEYRQKYLNKHLRVENNTQYTLYDIIGSSEAIENTVYMARKVANNNAPVLIYGDTGTGKELFAQGIHNASINSKGHFVAINCAAIPENLIESLLFGTVKGAYTGAVNKPGLLEEAAGGTLFLDELNSLPMSVQGKLLRVLQEREACRIGDNKPYRTTCRFLSATNQDPQKLIREKCLRSDLYFRLAVITLEIPPLREREDDIADLSIYFIRKYNKIYQTGITELSPEVRAIFNQYSWPGNVREMEHIIEYMMNFATPDQHILTIDELPRYLQPSTASFQLKVDRSLAENHKLNDIVDDFRREILVKNLENHEWNVSRSAKTLGISREDMYYYIKKYNLNRP
ncbi:MAG: sigma 54-interacting transcriptional regulator, partial [Bacillota bacterium]|nr:sigma 54-interacting transcriptional regulator [Bacillota bacterium]